MVYSEQNPIGLNGVDFLEYSGPDAKHFENLFHRLGFQKIGVEPKPGLSLYRQGDINFILNTSSGSFAQEFHQAHGPSICSSGFRVFDAEQAFQEAVRRGAKPYEGKDDKKGATPFPAVYGIGDSLIYFIDPKNSERLYTDIFKADKAPAVTGHGLQLIDHFTNNVPRGEMQKWCDFYINVFNFRETRYFDIKGKMTGLFSKVMRSPCGKFSVPINEPQEGRSQIQEYLDEYKGSGIQHVALLSNGIIPALDGLREQKVEFLTPPPKTYYTMLQERLPKVTEDLNTLEQRAILVDGDDKGYLLQIFTKNVVGPIFFEIIQRKGHDGFGDGNFQALFDAMERDQMERGYL